MADGGPGVQTWTENTSSFDRVQSVSQTVSQPRSASWIAREAAVSERTARRHLKRLVDMAVLREGTDAGTTMYEPDPIYTQFQLVRDLLEEYTRDELRNLEADLHARIKAWRHEYNVDSPQALRALAAKTKTADETATIRRTADKWDLIAYRLSAVRTAIDRFEEYSINNHSE